MSFRGVFTIFSIALLFAVCFADPDNERGRGHDNNPSPADFNRLREQLDALAAEVQINRWEREVRQAQAVYNFQLDRLFDISCISATNRSLVNRYVDNLMESFCPDFTTWTAAVPAPGKKLVNASPSATGFAQVRQT
jgi:hypothetical protein